LYIHTRSVSSRALFLAARLALRSISTPALAYIVCTVHDGGMAKSTSIRRNPGRNPPRLHTHSLPFPGAPRPPLRHPLIPPNNNLPSTPNVNRIWRARDQCARLALNRDFQHGREHCRVTAKPPGLKRSDPNMLPQCAQHGEGLGDVLRCGVAAEEECC